MKKKPKRDKKAISVVDFSTFMLCVFFESDFLNLSFSTNFETLKHNISINTGRIKLKFSGNIYLLCIIHLN